jgi:hypothetical protein
MNTKLDFKKKFPLIILFPSLLGCFLFRFQLSLKNGRAGAPPSYDDITYFLDGRLRLEQLKADFFGGLLNWVTNPPHSPMSSVIAVLGQLFKSNCAPVIYMTNSLVIIASLALLFHTLNKNFTQAIFLTCVVIASPIGPMLMFNFRPDCLYSIFLTIAILKIFDADLRLSVRALALYGAVLLLVKPSFIIYTIIDLVLVFIFTQYKFKMRSISVVDIVKSFGIFVLLAGWYLINGLNVIMNYILTNTTGKTKSLWTDNGYFVALAKNSQGLMAQIGIGFSLALISLFFIALLIDLKSFASLTRISVLFIVATANLLISMYSMIDNPFFYLTTAIPYLYIVAEILSRFIGKFSRSLQTTKSSILIIPCIVLLCTLPSTEWAASAIRSEGAVPQQFARFLQETHVNSVYFLYAGGLNADTTNWYLGSPSNVKFSNQGLNFSSRDEVIKLLSVVLIDSNVIVTRLQNINGFPSDRLQEFINKYILANISNKMVIGKKLQLGNYLIWDFRKNS